jgi:opacity protein-like surface antigen
VKNKWNMKKVFLLSIVLLPLLSQAQDISLHENYKTNNQQRLEKFKPNRAGDLILNAGLGSMRKGYGLSYNFGAEYMLTEKVGIRANYTSNNTAVIGYWSGASRLTVDVSYHFIQNKRWDVYAVAGIGAERMRYRWMNGRQEQSWNSISPVLNAGVGARYKVTPNFGVQVELGRVSNIGVYKKFGLKRK